MQTKKKTFGLLLSSSASYVMAAVTVVSAVAQLPSAHAVSWDSAPVPAHHKAALLAGRMAVDTVDRCAQSSPSTVCPQRAPYLDFSSAQFPFCSSLPENQRQPGASCQQDESLAPIFQRTTHYALINKPLLEVVSVFHDYSSYETVFGAGSFGAALMLSVRLQHSETSTQTFDVQYQIPTRYGSIRLPVSEATYVLRNKWRTASHGGFENAWAFWRSQTGVHYVEGGVTFTPVTVTVNDEQGNPVSTERTLVKYVNYINPADDSTTGSIIRSIFNTVRSSARSQNVSQIGAIVTRLKAYVEANGATAQQREIFQRAFPGTR